MSYSNAFRKELDEILAAAPDNEFNRDAGLRPQIIALRRRHGLSQALEEQAADALLDRAEKQGERASQGFFPYDALVPLGGKQRIRRGKMELTHCQRRKEFNTKQFKDVEKAYYSEDNLLDMQIARLELEPPGTTVEDVFPAEETPEEDAA